MQQNNKLKILSQGVKGCQRRYHYERKINVGRDYGKYPDQWLGMEDVEWENESNIESAIVVDSISSMSELTEKQISSGGKFVARYTTPNNSLYINTLGVF